MSKKKKRQARKTITKEAPTTDNVKGGRRSDREFNPDYSYVTKDLKRIGTLAGAFTLALIVLAFFLN